MKDNRKMAAGSVITFITLVLSVVSFAVYRMNIKGEGYFQNAAVPMAANLTVAAIILAAAVLIAGQFQLSGIADVILKLVTGAVRIIVPVLCIAAMMYVIDGRIEGFAFIYMSNEEVLHEVQTAANMSSAHGAIANIVLLGVSALFGIIAAFFNMSKQK